MGKRKKKYKEWKLPSDREVEDSIDMSADKTIRWEWYYHSKFSMICLIDREMATKSFKKSCIALDLNTTAPSSNQIFDSINSIIKENNE